MEDVIVGEDEEGPIMSNKIRWLGETDRTVEDAVAAAMDTMNDGSAVGEASIWLHDWLSSPQRCGEDYCVDLKKAGRGFGHSEAALNRARKKLGVVAKSRGNPKKSYWILPGTEPFQTDMTVGDDHGA
jgi:hypothetical protein